MNNISFALKQSAVCGRKLFLSEKSHQFRPPPIIGEFFYDLGGREKLRTYGTLIVLILNYTWAVLNIPNSSLAMRETMPAAETPDNSRLCLPITRSDCPEILLHNLIEED